TQYSEYIRNTYTRALNRALVLTYSRFPMDRASIAYFSGAEEGNVVHIETITSLREIATAFDLSYIYLVQRYGPGDYRFLLSSYDTPGIPDIYSWDDAPPELGRVFSTGQIAITDEYTDAWGTFVTAFLPVIEDGQVIAVWGADFSLSYIQALRLNSVISLIIAFLGSSVIAVIFAFVVSSSLTRPIHEIEKVSAALAVMDFSVHIDSSRKDEIGKMQKAFMQIRDSLKSNFSQFSQNASKVSNAVYDLSSSAKEITTTANEQSTSVAEIVSTMENNKGLSGQIAIKTTEVAELAAQTENLSQHGANLHGDNEHMMADIRKQNSKVVDEIRNLTDVLFRINESVQFIDTIADRTKIIAFNAALEASSAGEAGQRFSVVASEIRRFAVNVVESVSEIKERISELQEASESLISEANIGSNVIDSGYNRMVEQKEVFENIVDVSQNVAVRSQQISNLSKQQDLASGQVFTALKEISAGVNQFVVATSSTSAAADNLKGIAQELRETLARYRQGDV
ncbi:MAG: methyl-accepting chemotaxis protein, partial [Treponema sp.]|nr:methyl-accepting chemotaxis protein [Treponema sp.]